MVKMLLEGGDVTPHTKNKDGRTPLSWAAQHGHFSVVNLLEKRWRVIQNYMIADPIGQTSNSSTSEK